MSIEPEVITGHGPWRVTTQGRRVMVECWTQGEESMDYYVFKGESPVNGTEHPRWASPPYPNIPPNRLDRALIKMTEWMRRRYERRRGDE